MARKSRKNVGLIGLGIIGARVAAGLRAAGYHAFVWNRTPKPVPNFVGSPREVAEICDIIQIFVADAQAVRDVVEAFGDQLTSKHIIINCATIGPESTVDIAQIVQGRGAAFLDAPFTGSKGAAEKSQLCYYVGGEEEVFLRAKPVLEATSKAIVRCGRVGDAATLKVATNLITAVTTQTLAEALAITRGAGIAPEALAAALEHNACKSGVVELKLPKMVNGDYEPHFSVKHMFKDVQLGIHIANQQKLEIPLTTVVGGVLYGALCNGWGDLDFSSVYRVYSELDQPEEKPALPAAASSAVVEDKKADEEAPKPAVETAEAAKEAEPVANKGEEPAVVEAVKAEAAPVESVAASPEPTPLEKLPSVVAKPAKATVVDVSIVSEPIETAEKPKTETPKPESPGDAEIKPEVPVLEAAKAGESKLEADAPASGKPKDASAVVKAAMAEIGETGADAGGEEDSGLAGFFSRVFRRKGAPGNPVSK